MLLPVKFSRIGLLVLLAGALSVLGCSAGGGKRGQVYGKVTLDNQPLPVGAVTYYPYKEKGNTSSVTGSGSIDAQGNYDLMASDGKKGLPLGWYKVTIATSMPTMNPKETTNAPQINQKFQSPTSTTLAVEVVESPGAGAYDLKVTK